MLIKSFVFQYWLYKFRNVTTNSTDDLTPIQAGFTSDLSVSAAVPNTLFLILNAFVGHKIPLKYRMVGSMTFVFLFFIVTTALVEVNTDSWQNEFFIFTLTSVVMMNSKWMNNSICGLMHVLMLFFYSCYCHSIGWAIRYFRFISVRIYNSCSQWSGVRWYIRCSGRDNFVNIWSHGKDTIVEEIEN